MVAKRFWKPSVTSQFRVCPIPYHLDTYRGCVFNCAYCFARDFTTFGRRRRNLPFIHLEANDPAAFARWVKRTAAKAENDYDHAEEVAFHERIPLKIGATADPFPPIELVEGVTKEVLHVLHDHDYPTEIQTKNPAGLWAIAEEFRNPNWTVSVTLITPDEEFRKVTEPGAPPIEHRLAAIRQLVDLGIPVLAKCQPTIVPLAFSRIAALVEKVKAAGCWGFITEGLKLRVAMPVAEQEHIDRISKALGFDLRAYYRERHIITGSDFELPDAEKMLYSLIARTACERFGLSYFSADNGLPVPGSGLECCGTEKLRGFYQIWGGSVRTRLYGHRPNESKELGKCVINFCRSPRLLGKTMNEVVASVPDEQTMFPEAR